MTFYGKVAAGAVIAFALTIGSANAALVSADTLVPSPYGELAAPTSNSADFRLNFVGSDLDGTSPNSRSPWEGTPYLATGQYNSVEAGGFAEYVFGSLQTEFSLLWGSPDSYNVLTFFDAFDVEVFSIIGTALTPPGTPGAGFVNVLITDLEFVRVRFESIGADAFEYAAVSAVPLPAALPLFAAAMAGFGFLGARRRKRAEAIAA